MTEKEIMKSLEGRKTMIYQKPIGKTQKEGAATIRKVLSYEGPETIGHLNGEPSAMLRASVEFEDEPGATYDRWIVLPERAIKKLNVKKGI